MRCGIEIFPALSRVYNLGFSDEQIAHLGAPLPFFENVEIRPNVRIFPIVRQGETCAKAENGKIIFGKIKNISDDATLVRHNARNYVYEDSNVSMHQPLPESYIGYEFVVMGTYYGATFGYIKNIKFEDIQKLVTLQNFFSFYVEDSTSMTNIVVSAIKKTNCIFDDVDTMISAISSAFFEFTEQGLGETSGLYLHREVFTNFMKLLFPDAKITSMEESDLNRKLEFVDELSYPTGICVISDVVEINNRRYARIIDAYNTRRRSRKSTGVIKCDVGTRSYDYVDVGRIFHIGERPNVARLLLEPLGTLLYLDDYPQILTEEVIKDIELTNRDSSELPIIAGSQEISVLVRRYAQKLERLNKEETDKKAIANKFEERLAKLKIDAESDVTNPPLNINGVVMTKDSITYEGQTLTTDLKDSWVYDIVKSASRYVNINTLNFDHIFSAFLKKISSHVTYSTESTISGKIGDVDFKITRQKIVNTNGSASKLTYINGKRVNIDEIEGCLERALCFTNVDDFNYFLSEVSKCSLRTHKYLMRGITMTVRDDFNECEISMKLPIVRKKNINYLVIGENEFRVRDTNKLINLMSANNLVEIIEVFMNSKYVVGISFDQIRELIDAAKKEFITAVEKSQKLLKETEERFKIKIENHRFSDGKICQGYLIKGALNTYVLEVNPNEPDKKSGVFRYPSGSYVCIVDKSTAQVGMDKIVNRIYALHNDQLLAGQISTLH